MPFVEELYYVYDYGDDWCVKITCLDAYTANEDYDHRFGVGCYTIDKDKIPADELKYKDRNGKEVDDALREKLQTVYTKTLPVCVYADGLNVMDDVGGLYGFQEFLQTINSKLPDDAEEKESAKEWARGMGWTGRKVKAENIL